MPFVFLKYLQPTHYFRLPTKKGEFVFPKVAELPENVLRLLIYDTNYQSGIASDYDLAWQAIQAGYLGDVQKYKQFESVSVQDNYRFIRKHFHKAWVVYVFLLRLLGFNNPLREWQAFFKTRSVGRIPVFKPITHPNYNVFSSPLIDSKPLVSVVIPTLNRYTYLHNILKDLEAQDYRCFEVLVVDQSDAFRSEFYNSYDLNIRVIRQTEKALWLARNTAVKQAKGEFIALSEDDVRIEPNWISSHLNCLDFFDAQVSAGVFYPEGQTIPQHRSFFAVASQFATGNTMLYKSVFEIVGLFDRQFEKQRMGDGEFGMRVFLAGLRSISNPKASCVDVKASTGGLREMGSWDAFRPSNFLAPRPIPSVLYYFRRYYGNAAARWALLRTIPTSILPYQFKKNRPMLVLGLFLSILLLPVVMVQVYRSWILASKKLKAGPLIDVLQGRV